jgi:hypothetical protein
MPLLKLIQMQRVLDRLGNENANILVSILGDSNILEKVQALSKLYLVY